ncbi:MAG: response regulator, partial [Nitrospirae bacterium]|nr:response regulator [Nitrospirota bacterium]
MRILITDDDIINCTILQTMLVSYGDCDIALNGKEAFEAFVLAHKEKKPYELIFLDIMMPVLDGCAALMKMRKYEAEMGLNTPSQEAKIVMATALDHPKDIMEAYDKGGCTAYLVNGHPNMYHFWSLKNVP